MCHSKTLQVNTTALHTRVGARCALHTHTHTRFTSLRALAVDNTSAWVEMARNAAPNSRLAIHEHVLKDLASKHYCATHAWRRALRATHTHTLHTTYFHIHIAPPQRFFVPDKSTMHMHSARKFQALYVMTHTFRGLLST